MNFYPVLLVELIKLKRMCFKSFFLGSVIVGPLLYFVTFGWGLSENVRVGNMNYSAFLVPGIVALSSMTNSFVWTSLSVEAERVIYRTFDEYLVSPITPFAIMLGKVIGGSIRGVLSGVLVLSVAVPFGVVIRPGVSFFVVLLLNSILFSSLGIIFGLKSKVHGDVAAVSALLLMPMGLFCGTFFPISVFPFYVRPFVYLLPFTHSVLCLRASVSGGLPLFSLGVLSLFSAFSFSVGVLMIGRARREQ